MLLCILSIMVIFTLSCTEHSHVTKPTTPTFINPPLVNIPQPTAIPQYLQGKRYKEREVEQQTLRKALAQLHYFDGDGQLRFYSGGYNGSVFWFNKSVIMTNEHVVQGKSLSDLEYINFSGIVFYKTALKDSVEAYVQLRVERGKKDLREGQRILSERIAHLKMLTNPSLRLQTILQCYESDWQLLKNHRSFELRDIAFIPIEHAIEKIWSAGKNGPDIALVILKKPIDVLVKDLGFSITIDEDWFAENNIYDPTRNGFIYAGTPLYMAGYGREGPHGSPIDKNKSLTAVVLGSSQTNDQLWYMILDPLWLMEREFYYFEPNAWPGDSGARFWAYLDGNNKISLSPSPLNRKKVSVGINNTTASGIFLTQSVLAQYIPHLKKKAPPMPLEFKLKTPNRLLYLLNFTPLISPEFLKSLYWYISYKIMQAERTHDLEERYLWFIILHQDITRIDNPDFYKEISSFEKGVDKALLEYVQKNDQFSPSEFSEEEWAKIIMDSKLLTDEQKEMFTSLRQDKIFLKLGNNFLVTLQNVTSPIKVSAYIDALNTWVNDNKYKRTKNYSMSNIMPDLKGSFATIEDVLSQGDE
jgi:hypothetical protein